MKYSVKIYTFCIQIHITIGRELSISELNGTMEKNNKFNHNKQESKRQRNHINEKCMQ